MAVFKWSAKINDVEGFLHCYSDKGLKGFNDRDMMISPHAVLKIITYTEILRGLAVRCQPGQK